MALHYHGGIHNPEAYYYILISRYYKVYICVACHSTILCIYYSSDLRTGSSVPGMSVLGLDGKSSSHALWLSLLFFGVHFISRKYRTHSENHNL